MDNLLNLAKFDIDIQPTTLAYQKNKTGIWKFEQKTRKQYAFLFVENGSLIHTCNGINTRVSKGEILFLKKGETYSAQSDRELGNPNCDFYVTSFDITSGNIFFDFRNYKTKHFEKMLSLFKDIAKCMDELNFGYNLKAKKILYEILYNLNKEYYYQEMLSPAQQNIEKAKNYIDENYKEKIMIEDLANISGYSRSYFKKIFKQCYHLSPSEYITMVRIDKAKVMLEFRTFNMREIALSCGFSSEYYFSQVFKKVVGCPPKKY